MSDLEKIDWEAWLANVNCARQLTGPTCADCPPDPAGGWADWCSDNSCCDECTDALAPFDGLICVVERFWDCSAVDPVTGYCTDIRQPENAVAVPKQDAWFRITPVAGSTEFYNIESYIYNIKKPAGMPDFHLDFTL